MRLEAEWQLARRIALLVADSPGHGLPRDELLAKLGMPWVDVKPSAMLAYKRGGIDFCRDYVIAPARRSRPQPELAVPFTDPFLHPLDTPLPVGVCWQHDTHRAGPPAIRRRA